MISLVDQKCKTVFIIAEAYSRVLLKYIYNSAHEVLRSNFGRARARPGPSLQLRPAGTRMHI